MNSTLFSLRTLLLTAAAANLAWVANSAAPLTIHTAIEVEFGTESGQLYQLQGSSNLVDWSAIGDPVFGVGRPVTQIFSTRKGLHVAFQNYRLAISSGPTNGFAPWSLSGLVVSLDDQPGQDLMRFVSETAGVDDGENPDAFTYVFSRTDLNTVTADLQYAPERHDLLTFTFTAAGMGTWVRDEVRQGKVKDRDVGVFTVLPPANSTTNPPPAPPPGVPVNIPSDLTGLAYVFQNGSTPDRLEFTSAGNGTEFGDDVNDDEINAFTYTYGSTGAQTALLIVRFKADKWNEYDLTFGTGNAGTFTRREFKAGVLNDTDTGTFSGTSTVTP